MNTEMVSHPAAASSTAMIRLESDGLGGSFMATS
jgi:hypothetical protein